MKSQSSPSAVDYLLQVRDVSLRRNGHDILRDVSLRIKPGEVHTLLGLNGSGKSSLAYALMGCEGYMPDAGEIWFAGRDITRASITERARLGLTLAWQEPARFEGLPVGVYLALGAKDPDRKKIAEGLEAVALAPDAYITRSVNHRELETLMARGLDEDTAVDVIIRGMLQEG
jgi:Fe-S cluster assembly ATP-binding protein